MNFDFADVLIEVMEMGASDLHLTAGSPPMVRRRGQLSALDYPALTPQVTRETIYSFLTNDQRKKLENELQVDLSYSIPGRARFRVNAYFQRASLGAAFRLIPTDMPRFESLGLPAVLQDFTKKPRGFMLVTGPTGSGKSTTLASMIDRINRERHEHIMTVEDPIEFMHRHQSCIINQRELGADAHSFALALKAALRQDPDVILVGEMRDLDTISTALTAAETGHLVFATLHTQDAAQTIDRVVDVFPPTQQHQVRMRSRSRSRASSPSSCCRPPTGAVVWSPARCSCPAVRNLIREGKTHQIYSALQTGGAHGMQTMEASLAQLVRERKITRELAESRSSTPQELRRLMGTVQVA